jgi:hypothetical protein
MRSGGICIAVVCLLAGEAVAQQKPPAKPAARPTKRKPPVLGFEMALGVAHAVDGLGHGHFGVTARLARTMGARRQIAVELGGSMPVVLPVVEDARAELEVLRAPVWLGVAMTVSQPSPSTRFVLAVRGGAVFYRREAKALTGGARAESDAETNVAGAVGPELRFEVELSGRTAFVLGLSADVMVGSPVYTYEIGPLEDPEEITVAESWLGAVGLSACLAVW